MSELLAFVQAHEPTGHARKRALALALRESMHCAPCHIDLNASGRGTAA